MLSLPGDEPSYQHVECTGVVKRRSQSLNAGELTKLPIKPNAPLHYTKGYLRIGLTPRMLHGSPHPESTPVPIATPHPPVYPAVGTTPRARERPFPPLGVHGHDARERVSNFEQISFRRLFSIPSGIGSRARERHHIVGEHMSAHHRSNPLRELAAECVALAERTNDLGLRVELLMIAQKWVTMANGRVAVTEPSDETTLAPK